MPQNSKDNTVNNITDESPFSMLTPRDFGREVANLVRTTQEPFWNEFNNAIPPYADHSVTLPATQTMNPNLALSNFETTATNQVSNKYPSNTAGPPLPTENANLLRHHPPKAPQYSGHANLAATQPTRTPDFVDNTPQVTNDPKNGSSLDGAPQHDYDATPDMFSSGSSTRSVTRTVPTTPTPQGITQATTTRALAKDANRPHHTTSPQNYNHGNTRNTARPLFHGTHVNRSTPYPYTPTATPRKGHSNATQRTPVVSGNTPDLPPTLFPFTVEPTFQDRHSVPTYIGNTVPEHINTPTTHTGSSTNMLPDTNRVYADNSCQYGQVSSKTSENSTVAPTMHRPIAVIPKVTANTRILEAAVPETTADYITNCPESNANLRTTTHRSNDGNTYQLGTADPQISSGTTGNAPVPYVTVASSQEMNYEHLNLRTTAVIRPTNSANLALPTARSRVYGIPALNRESYCRTHECDLDASQTPYGASIIPASPYYLATHPLPESRRVYYRYETAPMPPAGNITPMAQHLERHQAQGTCHICNYVPFYQQNDERTSTGTMYPPSGSATANPLTLHPINQSQNYNIQIPNNVADRNVLGTMHRTAEYRGTPTDSAPLYGLLFFHPITPAAPQPSATHYAYVYAYRASENGLLDNRQQRHYAPNMVAETQTVRQGGHHNCVNNAVQSDLAYINQVPVYIPNTAMESHTNYPVYYVNVVYPEGNPYQHMATLCRYILQNKSKYDLIKQKRTETEGGFKPHYSATHSKGHPFAYHTPYGTSVNRHGRKDSMLKGNEKNAYWSHYTATVRHLIREIIEENMMNQPHDVIASAKTQPHASKQDTGSITTNQEAGETHHALEHAKINDNPLLLTTNTTLLEKGFNNQPSPMDVSRTTEEDCDTACTPPPEYSTLFPYSTGDMPYGPRDNIAATQEVTSDTPKFEILPGVLATRRDSRRDCTISIESAGNKLSKPKNASKYSQQPSLTEQEIESGTGDTLTTDSHMFVEHEYARSAQRATPLRRIESSPSGSDIGTCNSPEGSSSIAEGITSTVEEPITVNFAVQNQQSSTKATRTISK